MKFTSGEKALIVAPHTDDAELCCGGTISKMVEAGVVVDICNLSVASGSDRQEAFDAGRSLKVNCVDVWEDFPIRRFSECRQEILQRLLDYYGIYVRPYDYIFAPSTKDTHQDHVVTAEEVFRVFKHSTILSWEVPWNQISFAPNLFINLSEWDLQKKFDAIYCYNSQINRSYFDTFYLESWARFRGGQVNAHYAEVFEIVRMVV